jgi:uncharacterized protein involved in exopolysaccharide biosynthesis
MSFTAIAGVFIALVAINIIAIFTSPPHYTAT